MPSPIFRASGDTDVRAVCRKSCRILALTDAHTIDEAANMHAS